MAGSIKHDDCYFTIGIYKTTFGIAPLFNGEIAYIDVKGEALNTFEIFQAYKERFDPLTESLLKCIFYLKKIFFRSLWLFLQNLHA